MLIKAGTYKFKPPFDIAPLTENIQNTFAFDFSSSLTDGSDTLTVLCDSITIYEDNSIFWISFNAVGALLNGERDETIEETIGPLMIYSTQVVGGWINSDEKANFGETITTDKDQEVDDAFGSWFIAYTNDISVRGLRKFNETVESNGNDYRVGELLQNTELREQIWNSSFIEITPISREIDGESVILEGFTVFFTSSDSAYPNMPSTLCKIKYTEQCVLMPVHFNNLFDDDFIPSLLGGFNVTATADSVVNEWLLANTKAVNTTKKFTRLYLGATVYSSNGKRWRKLQTEEYASEGLEFTSNGDGTCRVSGIGTCTDTDIVIPSFSPEGDIVTTVGYRAFTNKLTITSIVLPDTVTGLGENAFMGCWYLVSINIPNGVEMLSHQLLSDCISLPSIKIPSSVTKIRQRVFNQCRSLKSISFEGTVEQWNAIDFGADWNLNVPATYVQCTDGQVTL